MEWAIADMGSLHVRVGSVAIRATSAFPLLATRQRTSLEVPFGAKLGSGPA